MQRRATSAHGCRDSAEETKNAEKARVATAAARLGMPHGIAFARRAPVRWWLSLARGDRPSGELR